MMRPQADVPAWRTLWRLRRFLRPHAAKLALGLVLLLGIAAMDLLKPWPLKIVLDEIVGRRLAGETAVLLAAVAAAVVVIAVFEGLMSFLLVYFLNRAGRTIVFELRTALFDHVQRLSLRFHSRRSTGDLLTRVTSDVKALRDVMTESLAEVVNSTLILLGMVGVLLWLDWRLALVAIASAPLLFLALHRYTFQVREYSRAERRREGALASVAHEALGTIRLSRAFSREEDARRRFELESRASLESGFAAALSEQRFAWVIDVLAGAVTGAVLWFGVHRVQAGAITVGTLVVFLAYVRGFYKPLRTALKHANKISKASVRAERVLELLDESEVVVDAPGARQAPRLQGLIEFRDVCFAYEEGRPVLEGVDLCVPARALTAVVGPTGSGKTTLVSLVPRLYDPTAGAVLVDGEDVRSYTLESLRTQVAMVLQESVLLAASVAENIAYGRPSATRTEIVQAARQADAHAFVEALPQGYDTVVGERGETLSGGQRQRIALARAIVREAPIVILDEPLAGLDRASAAEVIAALKRLRVERTLLLVTHDLALARFADRVAVLADGRVVEQGPHAELVAASGLYRRLVEAEREERVVG
jgi:ABC-type multidrug transport system fused ATPase/permease subunit